MKRTLAVLGAAIALAAAGCGGGGNGQNPTPAAPSPHTQDAAKATLRIVIPAKRTDSSARPQYVSPDTKSISFKVPAMPAAQVVALTPGSSACPSNGSGGYTCTTTFTAPVGDAQALTVSTFASSDGSGTPLSTNTVPIDVSATADNSVTVTLNGVAATLVLTLSPNTVDSGSSASITARWAAKDAAGDAIIGPGSLVDSQNKTLTVALTSDASSGITIGDATGQSFPVTYDGSAIDSPTFTVKATGATGVANGTAVLTVNVPATPTPSPTPTATATPSSAPGGNAIANGDFETSSTSFAPWYTCYVPQDPSIPETDPNPVNSPSAYTSPNPVGTPTTAPTNSPNANDATVQQSVLGGGAVHGGSNAALVGMGTGLDKPNRGKGALGICQDVTVPANGQLTLWVLEGGNAAYYDSQFQEGAIFLPSAGLSPSSNKATALPDKILFSENNCWNVLNSPSSSPNSSERPCLTDHTGSPDLANGNVWREKGPYDLSSYGGQQVTLFLGIWNSSTSSTYYNYSYFDDVVLSSPT